MVTLDAATGVAKTVGTGRAVIYHNVDGVVDTHTEVRRGGREERERERERETEREREREGGREGEERERERERERGKKEGRKDRIGYVERE